MLKETCLLSKSPFGSKFFGLSKVTAFSGCFLRATPISHFFIDLSQSQIIFARQALMGYQ